MPDDNEFKLKDYERIIDDIIDEYFLEHNKNYDLQGLADEDSLADSFIKRLGLKRRRAKVEMLGEIPETQQGELNANL